MTHRMPRELVSALAIVAALSGTAAAQSADSPDRPAFMIGPVEVRPRFALADVGVDNNVFNQRDDPKHDFTFTARPDLELAVTPGRFRLSLVSGAQFVYYHEQESERATNRNFAPRVDVDLSLVKLFASASFVDTRARPNAEIDVRARHRQRGYQGGGTVKIGYRSSLGFVGRRTEEDYEDNVYFRGSELATTLNNVTNVYEGSFDVAVTDLTSLSLVVSREESTFERSPVRNARSWRIAPTVRFSPLAMIVGTASVGYRDFTGIDPLLPDYDGFIATGTVGLRLLDRFAVDTIFTRDVRYSYEEALPYYVISGGRGTVTTLLGAGIEVRASGGVESMNYRAFEGQPDPGRDRLLTYGGGGGLRLSDRARFIVEVEFTERTSVRDPSREYKNRRIFATLNWGASTR